MCVFLCRSGFAVFAHCCLNIFINSSFFFITSTWRYLITPQWGKCGNNYMRIYTGVCAYWILKYSFIIYFSLLFIYKYSTCVFFFIHTYVCVCTYIFYFFLQFVVHQMTLKTQITKAFNNVQHDYCCCCVKGVVLQCREKYEIHMYVSTY